jgi:hypothetical protein
MSRARSMAAPRQSVIFVFAARWRWRAATLACRLAPIPIRNPVNPGSSPAPR